LNSGYLGWSSTGSSHGSWYPYDSHIPVIFMGWGIKQGRLTRDVQMTDIAPTISALLRIQMPSGNTGKVVSEALK
jgi:phosphopentomutase